MFIIIVTCVMNVCHELRVLMSPFVSWCRWSGQIFSSHVVGVEMSLYVLWSRRSVWITSCHEGVEMLHRVSRCRWCDGVAACHELGFLMTLSVPWSRGWVERLFCRGVGVVTISPVSLIPWSVEINLCHGVCLLLSPCRFQMTSCLGVCLL